MQCKVFTLLVLIDPMNTNPIFNNKILPENQLKFQNRLNLACQNTKNGSENRYYTYGGYNEPILYIDMTKNLLKSSYLAVSNSKEPAPTRIPKNTSITFTNALNMQSKVSMVEWLTLLIESFFKENPEGKAEDFTAPLFEIVSEESGLYAPNMKYPADVFTFSGIILATAFNSGIGIRVELIESIYRCLWAIEPFDPAHLQAHDPVISNQFNLLLTADQDTITKSDLDMKKGQTVEDYVRERTADILYLRYKCAIDALVQGFYLNCNPDIKDHLSMFEFEIALTGSTRYSADDLFKACSFTPHNVSLINKFRQILEEFTDIQRMKFIKFATNSPINSYSKIPQINVYFDYVSNKHLPTAGTCARRISLPIISTISEWKRKIIYAIEETDTFTYVYGYG